MLPYICDKTPFQTKTEKHPYSEFRHDKQLESLKIKILKKIMSLSPLLQFFSLKKYVSCHVYL